MQALVVDDDVVDRKLIKRLLKDEPVNISEVDSVTAAISEMSKHRFDIVLLDYRMPGMNGIELLLELRSRTHFGKAAVIVVSASDDTALALECIEAGAQDFLSKSSLNTALLNKAILHANKRFELEKKMQENYLRIKEMAERDQLTGLSNRYHFEDYLKLMIANNRRMGSFVALLALDLDNFKYVNDTHGHGAGDLLLKQVVERISKCLRGNEGFARLGGDEFAVVLGNISTIEEVSNVGQRILNQFHSPFKIGQHAVFTGVSIGVALFPADACKSEELMKNADVAMYRAKHSGKNKICFYESEYQIELARIVEIQTSLRKMHERYQFDVHYQPIYASDEGCLTGFEALIRWPQDHAHYFTPDEFIPVAEKAGMIIGIGRWMMERSISQLSKWRKIYDQNLKMSVNVSPVELMDESITNFVGGLLEKYEIPPPNLVLEITETTFARNSDMVCKALYELSTLGVKIALDDFGTGFSSISHLMNYPIDIVKLDKSMQGASEETDSVLKGKVFDALGRMLCDIGFIVVAEGIETQEQLDTCKRIGINRVQGYLMGRPIPVEDAENLLIHCDLFD